VFDRLARSRELRAKRSDAFARDDDLPGDLVAQFVAGQRGAAQSRLSQMDLPKIEKAAGADAPVKRSDVILRFTEGAPFADDSAAETAEVCLPADRRNQRAVNRAALRVARGCDLGGAAFQFGPRYERIREERGGRRFTRDQRE